MEEFDASDNELDRLIEGSNAYVDQSDDEAVEDNTKNDEETGVKVEKKPKKIVLKPQPKLNLDLLQGPKGLMALNELFSNHKFRGSGHEQEDLSNIVKKLEQWSYRLFPKYHFEDSLKRLEALGKKRDVQVYLRKIRSGLVDDVVRQVDDDEGEKFFDDFDGLIDEQVKATQSEVVLTPDQLERIERNRRLAVERRRFKEHQTPMDLD